MASISASEVAKLLLGESQRSRSIIESHMDGLALSRLIGDASLRMWWCAIGSSYGGTPFHLLMGSS